MRKYIKKNMKSILLDIVYSNLYALCNALIPLITMHFFDTIYAYSIKKLFILSLLYFLLASLAMSFQYLSQKEAWRWTISIERHLKEDLMNAIMNENYADYISYSNEEYLSIFLNDVPTIVKQVFEPIIDIIKSSMMIGVYLIFMIVHLGTLTTFLLVLACLFALLAPKLTSSKLSRLQFSYLEQLAKFNQVTNDVLLGFNHTNEKTKTNVLKYYINASQIVQKKHFKYGVYKAFTIVFHGLIMYLLDILSFMIAGILLIYNDYTIGTASAMMNYMKNFTWPIRYIINDMNEIHGTKEIVEKINKILERKAVKKKTLDAISSLSIEDMEIMMDNFHFGPCSIHFSIHKKYAIIGQSGSGKSTLFRLITQQIKPNNGIIKINGDAIEQVNCFHLIDGYYHGHHIYQASAIDNITIFNTYTLDRLHHYLIEHPNDKINNLLQTKNCHTLSNGEQQMIALLRLLVIHPPILLLDEAFNAIDKNLRHYFINMILDLEDTMLLIITHDVSVDLLQRFDSIYSFQLGQLQEVSLCKLESSQNYVKQK